MAKHASTGGEVATSVESQNASSVLDANSEPHPEHLVGTWRWSWRRGFFHHVNLYADGTASKIEGSDQRHENGTWRVREDGILEVNIRMEFRIDDPEDSVEDLDATTLMDLETVQTDRDFPWQKVSDDPGNIKTDW